VFNELHGLALHRVIEEHLTDWRRALEYKGKGSAAKRASEIRGIYQLAAPVPGTVNTDPAIKFMKAVRDMVRTAVEHCGGQMRLEDAA
jgi:hypothetical protein